MAEAHVWTASRWRCDRCDLSLVVCSGVGVKALMSEAITHLESHVPDDEVAAYNHYRAITNITEGTYVWVRREQTSIDEALEVSKAIHGNVIYCHG